MKLTAIKTVVIDVDGKDADGKRIAVPTTYGPGQDFDAPADIAQKLLDRKKAGKRGEVEIPAADAPQEIPAESTQKPVDAKKK